MIRPRHVTTFIVSLSVGTIIFISPLEVQVALGIFLVYGLLLYLLKATDEDEWNPNKWKL